MKQIRIAGSAALAIAVLAGSASAWAVTGQEQLKAQGQQVQACLKANGVLGTTITETGNTFSCHQADGSVTQLFTVEKTK